MVTFPVTLTDPGTPNPVFKVTAFLKSNISNTAHFTDRVSIEHQIYRMYHFQWPRATSDPDFKITTFLKSNIVKTAWL